MHWAPSSAVVAGRRPRRTARALRAAAGSPSETRSDSDGEPAPAAAEGAAGLKLGRPVASRVGRGRHRDGNVRGASRARFFNRPSDRRGSGNTRGRNMRSRCRCSMCPAIHINSRSWLRSSSTHEPSDPPLRVVSIVRDRLAVGATFRPDDRGLAWRPDRIRTENGTREEQVVGATAGAVL